MPDKRDGLYMTKTDNRWRVVVSNREAADRIVAAQDKMKRNPVIEEVDGRYHILWETKETQSTK